MNRTKQTAIAFILFTLPFAFPFGIKADSYGSYSEPADLTIDKKVKNPLTGAFVDNLGSADPAYSPTGTVTFKFIVKNASGETFDPVTVTDNLPRYLTFESSSVTTTTTDAAKKTVTIKLEKMIAGESREFTITAKVDNAGSFTDDTTLYCENNYVKAVSQARPNGDDDTAQLCITTTAGGAKTLPVAGFEDLATAVPFATAGGLGIVLTGIGLALKKKS